MISDEEKELIKAGAEAGLKPFANLIERLCGGTVDQIGGMWEDRVLVRRQIRQIALFKELQAAIDEAGFDPRSIPDSTWIPAIQSASVEDNESLQKRWAYLLANASDPREERLVEPVFVNVLKDLTSRDVKFLDALHESTTRYDSGRVDLTNVAFNENTAMILYARAGLTRNANFGVESVRDWEDRREDYAADGREFNFTMRMLLRHGLLSEKQLANPIDPNEIDRRMGGLSPIPVSMSSGYLLTHFGGCFVMACRKPRKSDRLI